MTTLLTHRPYGIEHPYAVSTDQRVPVLPVDGQAVTLGVSADPDVNAVECLLEARGDGLPTVTSFRLDRAQHSAADAAALAGGEGHLAEAQAASVGGDGGWSATTGPLSADTAYRYRFTASALDGRQEETEWFDLAPARWQATGGRLSGLDARLVDGSVEWLVSGTGTHRVRFALRLAEGDHVVGFGERYDALDQAGRRLDTVVFEQYKSQGQHGRTYLPMPFAHVVGADGSAWGFHLRSSRRAWYDVGASHPDRLVVEVDLGGTEDESLDVVLYDGTPTDVLHQFLDEVGRATELPDWVFRLWASGNEWNTQELVLSRMKTHADLDIPVGVVVIEAWSDEEGIMLWRDAAYRVHGDGAPFAAADLDFPDDGAWPDPKAMVAALHERGIKVILWQIPLLKTALSEDGLHEQVLADGAALVASGNVVRESDGTPYLNRGWWFPKSLMPDLSTQAGRDYWTERRRYLVRDLDIDGFKTDGGEHAWGHDLRYGDGRRGDEGNNLYPVHYARAFGDLLRSEGKAPVTFSRSGFAGSQPHGAFWAGDEDSTWEAFRASITAGLTAAACGIVYWGWDLAGFSGPVPDAELYLRSAAAATFMPIMQYHSEFNHHQLPLRDRTPWHVAATNGDPEVVDTFRRYARLRERLVPYLADAAREAIASDRPLMRPLFFDYPDDPAVWEAPRQYLLGDALLVNPVTEPGATRWSTYLPAGEWVDVWSHEALAGSAWHDLDVSDHRIPVLCRTSAWPRLAALFRD
ncbi:glycoside hydrolase family 31 protein [Sinomonas sp. JGH33]|uniref:Glycoside hydrolase family 31 protein n=1 Tax=Sinomonas terricola TaxID=3110330 RepID=A0ABU5TB96_9MICC|nr:TIM-barrel domain-containing protein [Sinomonas sp. JGH33]MEA5456701.1 glycoside hydrolase family 31 protein [Sinomonas sp. JGH33]